MEITTIELERLNFYRASELHGGLVLGQLVQRARNADLILRLTRHSAEEVLHAELWTAAILEVGGQPSPVRDTYQRRLARIVGPPSSLFHVLALTQVFERRVYRHFIEHARLAGTHPVVRATLLRMVDEEKDHLSWVKDWLESEAAKRRLDLRRVLRDYAAADAIVYRQLTHEFRFRLAA